MTNPLQATALLVAALAVLLLPIPGSQACEKHLNGHQNSSESQSEGSNR
ncbi:hypothetical protein KQ306_01770 [Synechococcus sp. CS-1324]|nr:MULTISPECIES: hypothetical protein [unclassified Synechococcus]MCT0213491.1 hypothetical protein [Synechococcus sp. CS-1326]MCT0229591.1 hypothetical protein [Synechococcus sp. CS-1324]MCT0234648.1 hypothetical protein [Synechococcus sp. CS-1327]